MSNENASKSARRRRDLIYQMGAASPLLIGGLALGVFIALLTTAGTSLQHNVVDNSVAAHAYHLARIHGWLSELARVATFLGSTIWLAAVVAIAAVTLYLRKLPTFALTLVLSSIVGSAAVTVIKLITSRPRPYFADPILQAGGFAFPSGHATGSTIVYGMILLFVLSRMPSRRACTTTGLVMIVAAIAASRVFLGVHWVSDVIAGIALGVSIDALAWRLVIAGHPAARVAQLGGPRAHRRAARPYGKSG